jgi:hypothetical protein
MDAEIATGMDSPLLVLKVVSKLLILPLPSPALARSAAITRRASANVG